MKKYSTALLFAAATLFTSTVLASDKKDVNRTFQEICSVNAFHYEEHTVLTEDDYILTVFRIPGTTHEATDDSPTSKPPILM